jgi:hypothetical protein
MNTCISFVLQLLYNILLGPGLFLRFAFFFAQLVGLFGRVISMSLGRYLHSEQHKHRINARALSGIRTPDPNVRASEDNPWLGPRDDCDRQIKFSAFQILHQKKMKKKNIWGPLRKGTSQRIFRGNMCTSDRNQSFQTSFYFWNFTIIVIFILLKIFFRFGLVVCFYCSTIHLGNIADLGLLSWIFVSW